MFENKYHCQRCKGTGEEPEATLHGKTYDACYDSDLDCWAGYIYSDKGAMLDKVTGLISDMAVFIWARDRGVISRYEAKYST